MCGDEAAKGLILADDQSGRGRTDRGHDAGAGCGRTLHVRALAGSAEDDLESDAQITLLGPQLPPLVQVPMESEVGPFAEPRRGLAGAIADRDCRLMRRIRVLGVNRVEAVELLLDLDGPRPDLPVATRCSTMTARLSA
jgi:hypothetical protein